MICNDCSKNKHKKCKKRNEGKQGLFCDCQHRDRKEKTNGDADNNK